MWRLVGSAIVPLTLSHLNPARAICFTNYITLSRLYAYDSVSMRVTCNEKNKSEEGNLHLVFQGLYLQDKNDNYSTIPNVVPCNWRY
jgi:hypothetical protein